MAEGFGRGIIFLYTISIFVLFVVSQFVVKKFAYSDEPENQRNSTLYMLLLGRFPDYSNYGNGNDRFHFTVGFNIECIEISTWCFGDVFDHQLVPYLILNFFQVETNIPAPFGCNLLNRERVVSCR